MDARALNRRGTFRHLVDGQDDVGQPTQVYANLITSGDGTVACNVRYLSGTEAIKAGADTAVAKASIRVRRRAGITTAMQFIVGGTTFRITAVLPDETRKDYMDLTVEVIS